MVIIASLPMSQEIWLSSIGTQCHLNLCVALILILETQYTQLGRVFTNTLLILGPLSGPGSSVMVPLFLLRAALERSKARLFQALILATAALVQFAVFWRPQERTFGLDPLLLLNALFVKHIMGPFLGVQQTLDLAGGWRKVYQEGHIPCVPGIIAAVIIFSIFAFAVWRNRKPEPIWFYCTGLMLTVLSCFGCLGDHSALLDPGSCERYVFAPQVLFELALLNMAYSGVGLTRLLSGGIIAWLLVIGMHEYFWTPGYFTEGTSWRSEVRHWREDPKHRIKIWPIGNWYVDLN